MSKQTENKQSGNGALRRMAGLGRGRSIAGAAINAAGWAMLAGIQGEIAPEIQRRIAADEQWGMAGHYVPEQDCADWPRSKEFGEASEGGEVQSRCGHGYYPAHVAHGGESRGGGDMASENNPILAGALAVADEKAITAAHSA